MNGLSDTLTIGLVLALIFGALFFYLYSRIGQAEKRVSLTENILLDLKMATENTMMAMSSMPTMYHSSHEDQMEQEHQHQEEEQEEEQAQAQRVKPVSAPEPMEKEDVEEIPDEDFYKKILDQAQASATTASTQVAPSYESMTLKELKAEAKRKGLSVSGSANKKEVIDTLKRKVSVLEPVPGGDQLEEGFPIAADN